MTMIPETIDKEVKNINEKDMVFFEGGAGWSWEVWINEKTDKKRLNTALWVISQHI